MSTVIGCMQDLLTKIFIDPGQSGSSFFAIVQSGLRNIVYAVLIIYLCMVGINVMIASKVPERGEVMMYIIKFALVVYFATGSVWYSLRNDGNKDGLYPALLSASQEIAGFFMVSQNDNDPIGFCRYNLGGSNIFQERLISTTTIGAGVKETIGTPGFIRMTIWDLIDCKLLNYLNLGSCRYDIAGLMGVWIIGAAFFGGLNGFLLSIVSIIYCCMLLEVLFKFAHIFILSMFVLTILVLVSPIMVCFGLFNYTKSICSKWMSMILGYVLYPSLLFAFIALMLATFDSVYYGDLKLKSGLNAAFPEVVLACQNVDSIFCLTYKSLTNDPCKTPGEIVHIFSEIKGFALFGKFTLFRSAFIGPYLDAMLELMLFAFLFYLFMGSVTSFVAILTGVPDLSGMAAGGGAGFGAMISMGKAAASGFSSAYSGIKSAFDGKK